MRTTIKRTDGNDWWVVGYMERGFLSWFNGELLARAQVLEEVGTDLIDDACVFGDRETADEAAAELAAWLAQRDFECQVGVFGRLTLFTAELEPVPEA